MLKFQNEMQKTANSPVVIREKKQTIVGYQLKVNGRLTMPVYMGNFKTGTAGYTIFKHLSQYFESVEIVYVNQYAAEQWEAAGDVPDSKTIPHVNTFMEIARQKTLARAKFQGRRPDFYFDEDA